ncbi:hypothetical protein [Leptolyngbya sp. Heron Island J]|uniref:hypothetical protein n=1 Tax=Leptolyngbya sp. Heron Island J TaxID=1385935 RepID=UPI00126849B4|nr:hypothetical protein [Leptolyngbya sp. Heron Island J]
MALVFNVLGHLQQQLTKMVGPLILVVLLLINGCSQPQTIEPSNARETSPLSTSRPSIKQVDTPSLIRELTPWLDTYEPQVKIRQPQAEQIFDDTAVTVVFQVQDLPIYKDETWNMGPHIELMIDNQPYGSVYNLEEPIIIENLTPGTHTIRAFATRPWHESFKNTGAYAQVTFHVLAKTDENSPVGGQPLLTYGAPVGRYGAEPVLLDFYLTDAPLHQVAQDNPTISDWQVRYTINGDSFTLKDWDAVYIKGLKPGKNWVQLTLVDDDGQPIQGVFNNTVRLIEYDPALDDGLAKITRGDLTLAEVGSIVDPTYEPPVLEVPEPAEKLLPEDLDAVQEPEKTPVSNDVVIDTTEPEATDAKSEDQSDSDSIIPDVTEPEAAEAESESPPEKIGTESSDNTDQLLDSAAADQKSSGPDIEPDESANEPQPVEETAPDTEVFDTLENQSSSSPEMVTEPEMTMESESSPNPVTSNPVINDEVSDESSTETVDEEVEEISQEAESDEDGATAKTRRYLQRLYDYRDRSMQTYGGDR